MSQVSGNQIAEGVVKITADTKPAMDSLDQLKAEMTAKFAAMRAQADALSAQTAALTKETVANQVGTIQAGIDSIKDSTHEMAGIMRMIGHVAIPVEIATRAFELGAAIRETIDDIRGLSDAIGEIDFKLASGMEGALARAEKHLDEMREKATGTKGLRNALKNLYEFDLAVGDTITGGDKLNAFVQREQQRITDAEKVVDAAKRTIRADSLREEIERTHAATLEGVEKLEHDRSEAIKKARARYGNDAAALIDEIDKKYDREIARFNELEAKKKEAEDKRIEREQAAEDEKQRRLNEMIERQFAANEKAAQKLADSLTRITTDASKQMAQMFDMSKISMTLAAIEANTSKLARQRQAQG